MKKFKIKRFLLILFIISILTVFTFFCAFARSDGLLGKNSVFNFFADCFYVFRFPTHTFFKGYIERRTFIAGLFSNVVLYGFLMECLFLFFKNQNTKE